MNTRTTLQDIANVAEVSVATVSMALSDSPQISEPTRTRITSLSQRMNYVPRRQIKVTETKLEPRRYALAIIGDRTANLQMLSHLQEISELGFEQSVKIELVTIRSDDADEIAQRLRVVAQETDGLLLAGVVHLDVLTQLESLQTPCVLFGTVLGDPIAPLRGCSLVSCDAQAMSHYATRALLEAGHRRIGMFCSQILLGGWFHRWNSGMRYAYSDAGVPFDLAEAHLTGDLAKEKIGDAAAKHMLSLPEDQRPTAYVVPGPPAAVDFEKAMRDAGHPLPAGSMIIGGNVDQLDLAAEVGAPIIYEDTAEVAKMCLNLLRLKNELEPSLVARHFIPFKTEHFDRIKPLD